MLDIIVDSSINNCIEILLNGKSSEESLISAIETIASVSREEDDLIYYLGTGGSSDVFLILGKCYKLPRVVKNIKETVKEEKYIDLIADYIQEGLILKQTEYNKSIVNLIDCSEYTLITEFKKGNTLLKMSNCELDSIDSSLFINLTLDLLDLVSKGIIPMDITFDNLVYDKISKSLTVVDVGEFKHISDALEEIDLEKEFTLSFLKELEEANYSDYKELNNLPSKVKEYIKQEIKLYKNNLDKSSLF